MKVNHSSLHAHLEAPRGSWHDLQTHCQLSRSNLALALPAGIDLVWTNTICGPNHEIYGKSDKARATMNRNGSMNTQRLTLYHGTWTLNVMGHQWLKPGQLKTRVASTSTNRNAICSLVRIPTQDQALVRQLAQSEHLHHWRQAWDWLRNEACSDSQRRKECRTFTTKVSGEWMSRQARARRADKFKRVSVNDSVYSLQETASFATWTEATP